MNCQHCGTNDATLNMAMQINNRRVQMHLCNWCFSEIKGRIMNSDPSLSGHAQDAFSNQSSQGNGANKASMRTKQTQGQEEEGLLDQLGKKVTNEARKELIDPVIGHAVEMKSVIETLNRRNKNNPVLIGEPGVGKTAIAEGLALKIVEGDVPAKLINKKDYVVDVASSVANTGIRGKFEGRNEQLIEELKNRD